MSAEDRSAYAFNYTEMVENALVTVLRTALQRTAAEGLPGEHHFYITFRTDAPGVVIPGFMKAAHPELMTVVLQHSFENLDVTEEQFSVDLSFQQRWHRVVVPFAAVKAFADPHAKFGLQFGLDLEDAPDEAGDLDAFFEDDGEDVSKNDEAVDGHLLHVGATVLSFDSFRKR